MPVRPPRAALRFALVLLLVPIRESGGQAVSSLDAGYAYVQFTGFQGSAALTFVPTVELERESLFARGTASISRFESGRWSSSGSAGLSLFSPAYRGLRGELAGSGNATAYRETRTAQALGQARVHVHADSMGGWLGAGTGTSRYDDDWQPHTLLDAGAWIRTRSLNFSVSLSSATYVFRDSTTVTFPGEGDGVDTSFTRFRRTGYLTDATGRVAWAHGRFDLDVTAGFRPISRYVDDRTWVSVAATAWLRPSVAIVATIGRQPENPLQNLAGLHFASFAVRLGGRSRVRPAVPEEPLARATDFTIIGSSGPSRMIYIQAPGASSVELASPFTDWTPQSFSRIGRELWVLALPVPAGTYDVVIRIDGGAWAPPPGLPAFDDEFNGRVGRVVVSPDE